MNLEGVALLAPRGEMQGGATHAGVGSPRRSANAADRPAPPATRRAREGCGRSLRCTDARRRANSGLGRCALISAARLARATPPRFIHTLLARRADEETPER